MPNTKISSLSVMTSAASGDLIPIVDISDLTMAATGTTKRVTQAVLLASVQPLDADLTALAGVTIAANTFPARSSSGSLAAQPITDFGLSLIDDAAAGNARTTLGLAIGTDVLALQPTRLGLNVAVTSSQMLAITSDAAATKGIFIKGAASQTGNYLEVVTSASAGVCKLTTNSAATVFNLHLGQTSATQSLIFSTTVTDARIESDGYGLSLRSRDGTQYVSIFTKSTTVAAFSVDANATMKYGQGITGISASSWTTQGIVSRTAGNGSVTYNDSTSTGTVATVCLNSKSGQIISATSATTYTNASTLYLESIPTAGANVTMTNRWSLHASGGAYVEGTLQLAGGSSLLKTNAALTAGATGNAPTLTAGPVAGNPTKWIAINDAGTTRYIPTW